jgi:hypothetical protein
VGIPAEFLQRRRELTPNLWPKERGNQHCFMHELWRQEKRKSPRATGLAVNFLFLTNEGVLQFPEEPLNREIVVPLVFFVLSGEYQGDH